MRALAAVAELKLPDCWIGAGFVRDAVWDDRHGQSPMPPSGDVDVLWFAPDVTDKEADRDIERQLRSSMPDLLWSVKNQARMHRHNGDAPYHSVADAMTHWPETATAVAARLAGGRVEISAPLGLDDLFALRVRPTAAFRSEKRSIFDERIASKRWIERYPLLIILDE
ncbi:nucleotidyltransferase family protein [Sphingopyxis macrogoltabida]|nr:nucleotidyltransferase family protein [Sphingopyxis macrogoltabida]